MFSRYFLPLLLLVAIIAVLSAGAEEEVEERGLSNKLMKKALKFLAKEFVGAAATCLEEAAEECKGDLKHFKRLAACAGNYLKENKGRCLFD